MALDLRPEKIGERHGTPEDVLKGVEQKRKGGFAAWSQLSSPSCGTGNVAKTCHEIHKTV